MYFDDQGVTGIPVPGADEDYPTGATVEPSCDTVLGPAPYDTAHATDSTISDSYCTDGYDTNGYDTNGDGRNDTILLTDPASSSVLLTDVDGDGAADIATEITAEGLVTVSEHTGDGQWTVVERDQLGSSGSAERADDASVGFASSGSDSAGSSSSGSDSAGTSSGSARSGSSFGPVSSSDTVVSIDPVTGEWIQVGLPPLVSGRSR